MKSLFLLVTLLSVSAFAGPEDHIFNQTCYDLVKTEGQVLNKSVPEEICLETLNIDLSRETIAIESYFQAGYYSKMKVTYLARKNEDYYAFRARNNLKYDWISCGTGETVALELRGLVSNYGEGFVDQLEVFVETENTYDSCHSESEINYYNYKLRN
jgi:hypothetical protein